MISLNTCCSFDQVVHIKLLYYFPQPLTYLPTISKPNSLNMDFVNKLAGGNNNNQQTNEQAAQGSSSGEQKSGGGFLGGIGDKLNSAAGGGRESEKNEDYLDKGEPHHTILFCSHD